MSSTTTQRAFRSANAFWKKKISSVIGAIEPQETYTVKIFERINDKEHIGVTQYSGNLEDFQFNGVTLKDLFSTGQEYDKGIIVDGKRTYVAYSHELNALCVKQYGADATIEHDCTLIAIVAPPKSYSIVSVYEEEHEVSDSYEQVVTEHLEHYIFSSVDMVVYGYHKIIGEYKDLETARAAMGEFYDGTYELL